MGGMTGILGGLLVFAPGVGAAIGAATGGAIGSTADPTPHKEFLKSLGSNLAVPALAVDYVEVDTVTKTQDVTPRDEYVIDTSYKFQLLKKLSLLPDVQLMLDPAKNPDKDSIWMVGLRGILTL